MAHGYRALQKWNHWLSEEFLGRHLLESEEEQLSRLLEKHYGKHVMLIGVPHQAGLLSATTLPCKSIYTPLNTNARTKGLIEGHFDELPIITGSIDLVIIPHTLEFIDNPRQLLAEACRVIKPEGLIAIAGFNPYSMWGVKNWLSKNGKLIPKHANLIHSQQIKNWLELADFQIEQQQSTLFVPPTQHANHYSPMKLIEKIGNKWLPNLGGIYVIIARAKVLPLTPIKMKWKQKLNDIRISTSISGHIARRSK